MDYAALVQRLRANLDKYPGFVNLNSEAATAITDLLAQQKLLVKEVEAARNMRHPSVMDRVERSPHENPGAADYYNQNRLDAARAATDAAFPGGLPK